MEQNIGSVGTASETISKEGEQASVTMKVGPVKLSVVASLDNKELLELVASKVPGGAAHDIVIGLEKILFPVA